MRIQDIARLANVSVATVSRVINNNNNVKEETKERINQIIKENNYYPNIIARNLSKNENNTIGVIVPDIKNLYFASIMDGIVDEANNRNLNIILGCSNENFKLQKKYIELFIEQRVKGIIIAVTQNSYDKINFFDQISSKKLVLYGDFTLESGYNLGKEILKREINAIYISNNSMTLGFLKALKELNINPESMEIATFEDNEIIRFIDEKIVSYDIPFSELSKKSIEILESLLKNDTSDTTVEINL